MNYKCEKKLVEEMARLSKVHGNTAEHPHTICAACATTVLAGALQEVAEARRAALVEAADRLSTKAGKFNANRSPSPSEFFGAMALTTAAEELRALAAKEGR